MNASRRSDNETHAERMQDERAPTGWHRQATSTSAARGKKREPNRLPDASYAGISLHPPLPPRADKAHGGEGGGPQSPTSAASPRPAGRQGSNVARRDALDHRLRAAGLLIIKVKKVRARPRGGRDLGPTLSVREGRRRWAREDGSRVERGRVRVHGQHTRPRRVRHRRLCRQDGQLLTRHGVAPVQEKGGREWSGQEEKESTCQSPVAQFRSADQDQTTAP